MQNPIAPQFTARLERLRFIVHVWGSQVISVVQSECVGKSWLNEAMRSSQEGILIAEAWVHRATSLLKFVPSEECKPQQMAIVQGLFSAGVSAEELERLFHVRF